MSKKKFVSIIILITLVTGVGFAVYDYFLAKKYIFKTVSTEEQAKKEVAAVTKIIRQSIDLPRYGYSASQPKWRVYLVSRWV